MDREPVGDKVFDEVQVGANDEDETRVDRRGGADSSRPRRHIFNPIFLGLAPLLAVFPFVDRISNGYLEAFDAADASSSVYALAFIIALFTAITAVGLVTLLLSWRKVTVFGKTPSIIIGVLAGVIGFALGFLVPSLAGSPWHMVADVVAGVLAGISLSLLVGTWGVAYASLTPAGVLVHTSVSLVITSLLWALGVPLSAGALCMVLCAYIIASGVLLLFSRRASAGDKTVRETVAASELVVAGGPSAVGELTSTGTTASAGTGASSGAPASVSGTESRHAALAFLWVSVAGLMFSFLTCGMTLMPEQAGTPGTFSVFSKVAAYVVTAGIILAMVLWKRKTSQFELDVFYKTILPLAAAILLVFPYIKLSMGTLVNTLIGVAGYMGFSLFYVLSFAALAMVYQVCRYPVERAFSAAMMLAGIALIAGIGVFAAVGEGGQTVSMCLQAAYLVAMTISAIRGSIVNHPTVVVVESAAPEADDLEAKCDAIAKEYGLSTREAEIVRYIARGRGAAHIAEALYISPETVRTHTKRIYDKTGVHKREELIDLINNR